METIPDGVGNFYLSQGVLGVTCIVLLVVVGILWRALEKARTDNKADIAAKDALISELQNQRLQEALAGRDIIRTFQATLDAFLATVRGGKQ